MPAGIATAATNVIETASAILLPPLLFGAPIAVFIRPA
jgi:hypothetical protein